MEPKKIYIFGAHSRAQTLAVYLQYLYEEIQIEAYLYNNDEKNPDNIEEIPVIHLDKDNNKHLLNLSLNYPVFIGTRGIYHKDLISKLKQMGFTSIYPANQEMDLKLRNEYLKKYYKNIGRNFTKLDKLNRFSKPVRDEQLSATIYVIKSPFDKPLQQKYVLTDYEKELYAGAVFAEDKLPNDVIRDDKGDNISDKNGQFCELTALYWMWKHKQEDILGLAHYRRHFLFPEDWKERMMDNHVDVILPVPLYVAPSVEENFKSRHDPLDWDFMMQYLKHNFPEDYQIACDFFKGNLYSPCNMFVMRREILNELCNWLFPILFIVAENGGRKENNYLNRYPGFISERLISLFFEKNREKYQLVYADKNFLF